MIVKMRTMVILVCMLLSGCSNPITNSTSIHGNAIIDWVDFVKLDGNTYTDMFQCVIKDPSDVTNQVVGEVEFKVGMWFPIRITKQNQGMQHF